MIIIIAAAKKNTSDDLCHLHRVRMKYTFQTMREILTHFETETSHQKNTTKQIIVSGQN